MKLPVAHATKVTRQSATTGQCLICQNDFRAVVLRHDSPCVTSVQPVIARTLLVFGSPQELVSFHF
jgi:hypothetical protein